MRLGDFGQTKPPVEDLFGWFGVDIRVHPDLSDLAIIDLFADMQAGDDGTKALAAMSGIAATIIHPDDVETFLALARKNRQSMEDIAQLAMEILGAVSGRPTLLPSDSSDGQQATAASSSEKALRHLEGRPDLQVAVLRRESA